MMNNGKRIKILVYFGKNLENRRAGELKSLKIFFIYLKIEVKSNMLKITAFGISK